LPVPVRRGALLMDGQTPPPLVIGPNSVVDVPVDGDFRFAEPTGSSLQQQQEHLRLIEELINNETLAFMSGQEAVTATQARLQAGQVRTLLSVGDDPVPWRPEEKQLLDQAGGLLVVLHLSGPMIFGVARSIALEQESMQEARALIVDLCDVPMLSVTVALSIGNVVRDAQAQGRAVVVAGASTSIRERLVGLGIVGPGTQTREAPDRLTALRQALALIAQPVEEEDDGIS
jgi:MFS superfamily sulfate permease-like transporter